MHIARKGDCAKIHNQIWQLEERSKRSIIRRPALAKNKHQRVTKTLKPVVNTNTMQASITWRKIEISVLSDTGKQEKFS